MTRGLDDAPLYLDDKRIAERLGVSYDYWLDRAKKLERTAHLPKRDPAFGNRRYWPAVQRWLDHRNGLDARSEEDADRELEPEEFI